jgi:outer membrane usher protein FimD/PapC
VGLARVGGLDVRRTQVGASAVFEEGSGAGQAVGRLSTGGRLGGAAIGVQASSSLSGLPQQSLTASAAAPAVNAVAGVQSTAEVDTYAGGVTGAVAFLGGRLKPTPPLYSSFALVRLGPDNAGVRVNGLRADAQGDVLVTSLQAYAENPVAVNGADLPMNARFSTLTEPVVPRFRSGVVVEPRIEFVRDAMLTVLVRDGAGDEVPIPPGAYATHPRSEERFPAGEDGAIYVAGLKVADTVTVSWRGGSCEVPVRLPDDAPRDAIPELGPFVCAEMQR